MQNKPKIIHHTYPLVQVKLHKNEKAGFGMLLEQIECSYILNRLGIGTITLKNYWPLSSTSKLMHILQSNDSMFLS